MTKNLELAYQAMWDVRIFQMIERDDNAGAGCPPVASRIEYIQSFRRCVVGWTALHIVVHPADRVTQFVPIEPYQSARVTPAQDRLRVRVDDYVNEGLSLLQV